TRNAAKVSHTRKRYGDQAIEELEHTVASKRDHRSDAHSLSKLESCDRLLRLVHNGLLASDRFQLFGGNIKQFCIARSLAETHIDHDLLDLRDRHRVLDPEFFGECRCDLALIFFF